jgi:hypothetical protein
MADQGPPKIAGRGPPTSPWSDDLPVNDLWPQLGNGLVLVRRVGRLTLCRMGNDGTYLLRLPPSASPAPAGRAAPVPAFTLSKTRDRSPRARPCAPRALQIQTPSSRPRAPSSQPQSPGPAPALGRPPLAAHHVADQPRGALEPDRELAGHHVADQPPRAPRGERRAGPHPPPGPARAGRGSGHQLARRPPPASQTPRSPLSTLQLGRAGPPPAPQTPRAGQDDHRSPHARGLVHRSTAAGGGSRAEGPLMKGRGRAPRGSGVRIFVRCSGKGDCWREGRETVHCGDCVGPLWAALTIAGLYEDSRLWRERGGRKAKNE